MVYILYGLFFLSCLVLIAAVLLQPGKTDAGALFTSNVSSTAFSPRGTATVLSKVTIAAATTFMLTALFLAMPALTGNVSVMSSNPESSTDANSAVPSTEGIGDNTNGALIETPATDEAEQKIANAQADQALPVNASVGSSANSNTTNSNSATPKP